MMFLIPTEKLEELGTLKLRGIISDSGYNWKETDIVTTTKENYEEIEGGLSKFTFNGVVDQSINGIGEVLIMLIGQPSSYVDDIYIDNFTIVEKVKEENSTVDKGLYEDDFSTSESLPYNSSVNFGTAIETSIENGMMKFKPVIYRRMINGMKIDRYLNLDIIVKKS